MELGLREKVVDFQKEAPLGRGVCLGEAKEAAMKKKLFQIMDLGGIGRGSMNVNCTDKTKDNILRVLK